MSEQELGIPGPAQLDVGPAAHAIPLAELPAPRLQLRWERNTGAPRGRFMMATDVEWLCHYELVLPLGEFDIRREVYDEDGDQIGEVDVLVVPLKGPTIRTSGANVVPCWDHREGRAYCDGPFRDSAHAKWDAALLGNLPVFVIAPDGMAFADGVGRAPRPTGSEGEARSTGTPT